MRDNRRVNRFLDLEAWVDDNNEEEVHDDEEGNDGGSQATTILVSQLTAVTFIRCFYR
jgi:hypothetical protein